jgi:hypothetical protein
LCFVLPVLRRRSPGLTSEQGISLDQGGASGEAELTFNSVGTSEGVSGFRKIRTGPDHAAPAELMTL